MSFGGLRTVTPQRDSDRGLRAYLDVLFGRASGAEFVELRYRISENSFASAFFAAHDHESVARAVQDRARSTDVYVGCAPRARRAGTKDAVARVHALWAECDGELATRAALAWTPRPPLVVASGSGTNVHAYWPLTYPLSPAEAEAANLRLAHALGADRACFDAGRILRPPGTWNHKHRPPRPVALLRLDEGVRVEPRDVVSACPEVDLTTVDRRWHARPTRDLGDDPLLRVPPDVYIAALLGARPGRTRKIVCPFHPDERPSLHVYTTPERGWTCFSCRRGGTIYDLAAQLWGMGTRGSEFVALRRRLVHLFELELAQPTDRDLH